MRKALPVLGGGVVVAATLAVAAATAAPTGPRATAASPLTGSVWALTSLAGKAPLKGTELTAEFTSKGRTSGSAGCNRYTGVYTVSGSAIRISSLATTRKACAQPIEHQETAFLKALSRARGFTVSGGTLTLKTGSGQKLATFKTQTQSLAGTSWEVLGYNNGKQAVVSVLAGTRLTAVFGTGGKLTGFAGCNDYNASYKASAPQISIGSVASTRKHCEEPPGVAEQETRYLAALETAAAYQVDGSRLELRTTDGSLAVDLRRK